MISVVINNGVWYTKLHKSHPTTTTMTTVIS